jgi:Ca-activated chloride channel family protein
MRPRTLVAAVALAGAALGSWAAGGPAVPSAQQPGAAIFSARAELVVLQVIVEDRRGGYVPDLPADAFTVLEDGVVRPIGFFAAQDAPADVGLLVDSSGSMFEARERVAATAAAFVATSHPEDEIFALTFNERVRTALPADAPFTSDAAALAAALGGAFVPWGRTALHDAILAGLAYVDRGRHQRKALVVVSDGGDNASAASFEAVVRRLRVSNTVIYTIAVVDPLQREVDPRRLRQIARLTGGEPFEPRRITDIAGVLDHIARDIRHAYTVGYTPANSGQDGRVHEIRVRVRAPGRRGLSVRTRQGYALDEG